MDDVLVIESWFSSEEEVLCYDVEEVMVLVLEVVKVVRVVFLYVDVMKVENDEFLLEFDLLRLERVRLNDME